MNAVRLKNRIIKRQQPPSVVFYWMSVAVSMCPWFDAYIHFSRSVATKALPQAGFLFPVDFTSYFFTVLREQSSLHRTGSFFSVCNHPDRAPESPALTCHSIRIQSVFSCCQIKIYAAADQSILSISASQTSDNVSGFM